jgi:hypothetical protein
MDKEKKKVVREKIDRETLSWLLNGHSGDINFTSAVKEANLATLTAALKQGPSNGIGRTCLLMIARRRAALVRGTRDTA